MSSKETPNFKYRVVLGDNADRPYVIQKKGWIFWNDIGKEQSLEFAKSEILKLIKHDAKKPGTVMWEYSHEDYVADKLKGQ